MIHHPLVSAALVWWIVLAFVVKFNIGTLILGLAPTAAVIVSYYLAKRQREQVRRETAIAVAEASAAVVDAAEKAKLESEAASKIAEETSTKIGEVHDMVNSQRDELVAKIAAQDKKIEELWQRLADAPPPAEPAH